MFFYVQNFLLLYALLQTTAIPISAKEISLHYAAELGDSVRVQHLIQQGTPIDTTDNRGRTALIYAASRGHLNIVKFLLEKGANIHNVGHYQLTPLTAAIKRHHLPIVKQLLEKGADVHLSDLTGEKPLQVAIESGHKDIVKLLLEHGADPNIFTSPPRRISMLNLAKSQGQTEILELLIKHGANPKTLHFTPNSFTSPIDTISLRKSLEKGVEPEMALRLATELGDTSAVRQLITFGVDINAKTKGGITALMVAVARGHEKLIQMLIQESADVFALDDANRSVIAYTIYIRDRNTRAHIQNYLHKILNNRHIKK